MNNELRPYDGYKKVPFQWLDLIPQHWKYKRAKAMYSKANRPVREMDEVVTCFRDGVVTLRKNRRTTGFTESIKEIGYQGIRKGDLVIHVMDAFAGAIGVSDSDGKSTPVYSVCVPKEDLNNYYYAYIVREMAKTGFIQSLYRGIRERSSDFRFEVFANQYLPIPPIEEQDQIVKYLDFQLAKINKFIKAKKKLIEALKEEKQAVINEAVTKGINPNVKMKASGINGVGDIPEHWKKMNCKRLISVLTDYTANGSFGDLAKNVTYLDSGYARIVRLTDLRTNLANLGVYVSEHAYNYLKKSALFGGEFLIANVGAYSGFACLMPDVNYPATLAPNMMMAKFHQEKVCTNFIVEVFNSNYVQLQLKIRANNTSAQPKINKDDFKQVVLAIPCKKEQQQILNYISENTKIIDNSIKTIEKEIELIIEYRTSLVSDLVTGKVDVRHIEIGDIIEDIEVDETEDEIIDEEDLNIGESEE